MKGREAVSSMGVSHNSVELFVPIKPIGIIY